MNESNWVSGFAISTEKDRYALNKAKRLEEKRIKQGWRYYKINERNQVLVPYKNGKPTAQGLKIIAQQENILGV